MKRNDSGGLMQRLQHNLTLEEKREFLELTTVASIAYWQFELNKKSTPDKRAKSVYKKAKDRAKGKLKKLYAGMQKSTHLIDGLETHFATQKQHL